MKDKEKFDDAPCHKRNPHQTCNPVDIESITSMETKVRHPETVEFRVIRISHCSGGL